MLSSILLQAQDLEKERDFPEDGLEDTAQKEELVLGLWFGICLIAVYIYIYVYVYVYTHIYIVSLSFMYVCVHVGRQGNR